jgi:hypothetical protein
MAFLNNMNFTINNQIINYLNSYMRMQNFKLMKTLVVLAALLLSTTIGYAQKKSKEEKPQPTVDELKMTQQPNDFRRNVVYSIIIPKAAYIKLKDGLETADKLVVMAKGENSLSIIVTNPNDEVLKKLRSMLDELEMNEKEFFTDILPWVMMSGDDGKDMPAYLNSLIEFYKNNPEVLYYAPKEYKEFPSESNIGRFFNFQRELGHVTKF